MRFDHAKQAIIEAVDAGGALDLTAIALRTGFYDHAHLDRDFAALTGTSPTGWLAEERRNIQAGGHRSAAELGGMTDCNSRPDRLADPAGPRRPGLDRLLRVHLRVPANRGVRRR